LVGEVKFIGWLRRLAESRRLRVFEEFCEELDGLNSFTHIIILYWFHLRDEMQQSILKVFPKGCLGAPRLESSPPEAQVDRTQ